MQTLQQRARHGRWWRWGVVGVLAWGALSGPGLGGLAGQEGKGLRRIEVAARRALLIGNAQYQHERALENTVADVWALAGALGELGFETTVGEDLTADEMDAALEEFVADLGGRDLALYYYSGHGLQVDAKNQATNYLLPVDYEAGPTASVRRKAVAVETVKERLEAAAQVRVLVLDACRDNPYKSSGGGLAAMALGARGTLIAYAAGAGRKASDNPGGDLGLYMTHLVEELQGEEVELGAVFERTQQRVDAASQQRQTPEIYDNVVGSLWLREKPGTRPTWTASGSGKPVDKEVGGLLGVAERQWNSVQNSENPEVLEAFARDFADVRGTGSWVAEAKRLAAELRGPGPSPPSVREWTNTIGMEFVWVEAGSFEMGSPEEEAGRDGDEHQHEVRLSRGYWLGKYEVTQGEWEAVMGSTPSSFKGCGARCPVETVSWEDAQEFIGNLNEDESGRGYQYRLPTEAEWEYAARAGTRGATPEGELRILGQRNAPVLDGQAWYGGNSGVGYAGAYDCGDWEGRQQGSERCGPHPVGEKGANGWGLQDMLGNVAEWVGDWHGEYPAGAVTDPRGPATGSARVNRGGSWYHNARRVRSARRGSGSPGHRNIGLGFRLVRMD